MHPSWAIRLAWSGRSLLSWSLSVVHGSRVECRACWSLCGRCSRVGGEGGVGGYAPTIIDTRTPTAPLRGCGPRATVDRNIVSTSSIPTVITLACAASVAPAGVLARADRTTVSARTGWRYPPVMGWSVRSAHDSVVGLRPDDPLRSTDADLAREPGQHVHRDPLLLGTEVLHSAGALAHLVVGRLESGLDEPLAD